MARGSLVDSTPYLAMWTGFMSDEALRFIETIPSEDPAEALAKLVSRGTGSSSSRRAIR